MSRINKTENNLQSVWYELDLAYDHMERAIEKMSRMSGLLVYLSKMVDNYDLSAITTMKNEIEIMMEKMEKYMESTSQG